MTEQILDFISTSCECAVAASIETPRGEFPHKINRKKNKTSRFFVSTPINYYHPHSLLQHTLCRLTQPPSLSCFVMIHGKLGNNNETLYLRPAVNLSRVSSFEYPLIRLSISYVVFRENESRCLLTIAQTKNTLRGERAKESLRVEKTKLCPRGKINDHN